MIANIHILVKFPGLINSILFLYLVQIQLNKKCRTLPHSTQNVCFSTDEAPLETGSQTCKGKVCFHFVAVSKGAYDLA